MFGQWIRSTSESVLCKHMYIIGVAEPSTKGEGCGRSTWSQLTPVPFVVANPLCLSFAKFKIQMRRLFVLTSNAWNENKKSEYNTSLQQLTVPPTKLFYVLSMPNRSSDFSPSVCFMASHNSMRNILFWQMNIAGSIVYRKIIKKLDFNVNV